MIDFATSREHVKQVPRQRAAGRRFVRQRPHRRAGGGAASRARTHIAIDFTAGDASLNRNPDFLYALFVPARAHLAIPVLRSAEPEGALDARRCTGPADVAGASANGADDRAGRRRRRRGHGPVRRDRSRCSTYLFSFVVGDFKVETGRAQRPHVPHVPPRDRRRQGRAQQGRDLRSARARDRVSWSSYTGIPYAFGKFDFVLIPAFQFGGMEHAGKILYNAPGLLLDESATQNQHLGRASVIAHETAHMWFGDLVTMRWFNDVWMKEVFANFMAAKIVNPSFPEVNHELRFLLSHYPAAYEVDRTPGANAIRQPLDNLNEAGSLYGAIIYQKAPIVMRHLEAADGRGRRFATACASI